MLQARLHLALIATLVACAAGCSSSTGSGPFRDVVAPGAVQVTGVVTYPGGATVYHALVTLDGGPSTYTDAHGVYLLPVSAAARTVTLTARDGFTPGMAYAETHSGSVRCDVGSASIRADIVLDHATPI